MFFDTPQPMVSADRALSNRPLLSRWSMRSNVRMIWWDFFFSFRRKSTADFISWFILVSRCSFLSKVSSMIRKRVSFCVCLFCNCEMLIFYFFSHIHSFQIHLENVCLSTVFSNLITELSFQCFIPKSHSLSTTISQSAVNTKIDFPIHYSL